MGVNFDLGPKNVDTFNNVLFLCKDVQTDNKSRGRIAPEILSHGKQDARRQYARNGCL